MAAFVEQRLHLALGVEVIADRLVITVGTVKNHMTNILGKLGVRNRWAAIRKTEELGLL